MSSDSMTKDERTNWRDGIKESQETGRTILSDMARSTTISVWDFMKSDNQG